MIKKYKRNSNDTVIKYLMSRGLTIPYRVYVNMQKYIIIYKFVKI